MNSLDLQLHYDARGRLVLRGANGSEPVEVEPVRMFPISDPDRWVVLCDRRGRELVCIEDPAAVPADARGLIEEELSRRQFSPVIQRIVKIRDQGTALEWHVETDRGAAEFCLDSEEDVRPLPPHRVLVVDVSGVRYHIPDTRNLDPASRRALERYL